MMKAASRARVVVHRWTAALLASLAFAAVQVAVAQPAAPFSFVALGHMPYTLPGDHARFERLIDSVNAMRPAFTLHVGNIKGGSTECSDANFQKVLGEFGMFDGPLISTIGDNAWTDCHREKAGKCDPPERLARVRQMFFKDANSFGKTKLPLTRQAASGPMVENARWVRGSVVFATIHVVGSNNGFERA